MTDGNSGVHHMKYNATNADRLGERVRQCGFYVNSGNVKNRRDTQDVFLLFVSEDLFQIFPYEKNFLIILLFQFGKPERLLTNNES